MTRPILPLMLIAATALSGCGRMGDSGWNPLGWWGSRSTAPQTLAPEGGYRDQSDRRPGVPQVLAARWQPSTEGRLLVVQGFAPVKGYSNAALVTAAPQPGGRMAPDADGVLRLRFVALPPAEGTPTLPATPATDTITVAQSLSHVQLSRITAVEIMGAANTISIRR
ncbi:hypothetical protein [Paracoccus sp. (in: a-proteobacteria)]|uniref:hypothetical protein n=1 Tax=Paracoccus sp. TaxID=267 RepID=UPI0026E0B1CC|nr:hypothetical protein [Paracoccus sp. (in: a-proteobacteria)]MDO5648011.1 hypothetical protein [Paracoccus sp. (in: a-proteobacteria)]